jgi:hypothetical protein
LGIRQILSVFNRVYNEEQNEKDYFTMGFYG